MIAVICFGFLAVLHTAESSVQTPSVIPCPGVQNPGFVITDPVITNAQLGKKIKMHATIVVNRVIGKEPLLDITVSKPDGTKLPCVNLFMPCQMKACNGTTKLEKEVDAGWFNTCPVPPGTYPTELSFHLPNNQAAKAYFGDGNVIIIFSVVDGGVILGCGSIPITIDVD